jgi:hypothetical protein
MPMEMQIVVCNRHKHVEVLNWLKLDTTSLDDWTSNGNTHRNKKEKRKGQYRTGSFLSLIIA